MTAATADAVSPQAGPTLHYRALVALMLGNFAIGTAVMLAAGTLNEIAAAFAVGPGMAGLLVTAGAIVMGVGAPVVAGTIGEIDRRVLLPASLVAMGLVHAVCVLISSFEALLVLRSIALIVPALYTAQAAAACRHLAPVHAQGRAIGLVFMGWPIASVAGVPLCTALSGAVDWRAGFMVVALISLSAGAYLYRVMPEGVRPARMSASNWRATLRNPSIMLCVLATLLSSTGQFVLFTFLAPVFKAGFGASPQDIAIYFAVFGAVGVAGSIALALVIDRIGAHRAAFLGFVGMGLTYLLWPLGTTSLAMAIVVSLPWALACFSSNSAQQARLAGLAPSMTAAAVALNSSAMYAGQAIGSAVGALTLTAGMMQHLNSIALVWLLATLVASHWASRTASATR